MADVFIGYKTEDRAFAAKVCLLLEAKLRYDVWWDQNLQPGDAWSADLDRQLRTAHCVIILWSPESANSPWVLQEAAVAKAMGKLVPARIEKCTIPQPYEGIQAANLEGWTDDLAHAGIQELLGAVVRTVRSARWRALKAVATPLATFASGILLGWLAHGGSSGSRAAESAMEAASGPAYIDICEVPDAKSLRDLVRESTGVVALHTSLVPLLGSGEVLPNTAAVNVPEPLKFDHSNTLVVGWRTWRSTDNILRPAILPTCPAQQGVPCAKATYKADPLDPCTRMSGEFWTLHGVLEVLAVRGGDLSAPSAWPRNAPTTSLTGRQGCGSQDGRPLLVVATGASSAAFADACLQREVP